MRARVAAQACIGWREMLDRKSWLDQPFGDNVVLWSRIDYLMRPVGEVSGLVRALHAPDPVTPDGEWALRRATGVELAALDAAWCEWVTTTYRKKRR